MLALKPEVAFMLTFTKECNSSRTTEARSKAKHDRGVMSPLYALKQGKPTPASHTGMLSDGLKGQCR